MLIFDLQRGCSSSQDHFATECEKKIVETLQSRLSFKWEKGNFTFSLHHEKGSSQKISLYSAKVETLLFKIRASRFTIFLREKYSSSNTPVLKLNTSSRQNYLFRLSLN